ncbi:unnamed protein product [Symbiodinium natans]|uniref:Uncharacterized protein n=1 Tax=Symbiodinium natans TaxID=878477 RepID=A0A812R5I4_9DINO|nr:unnamed protein product [Symbiodinium natans]
MGDYDLRDGPLVALEDLAKLANRPAWYPRSTMGHQYLAYMRDLHRKSSVASFVYCPGLMFALGDTPAELQPRMQHLDRKHPALAAMPFEFDRVPFHNLQAQRPSSLPRGPLALLAPPPKQNTTSTEGASSLSCRGPQALPPKQNTTSAPPKQNTTSAEGATSLSCRGPQALPPKQNTTSAPPKQNTTSAEGATSLSGKAATKGAATRKSPNA